MMGTEIFKIDAPWAEKLTKTRVQFLMTPTVDLRYKAMGNTNIGWESKDIKKAYIWPPILCAFQFSFLNHFIMNIL